MVNQKTLQAALIASFSSFIVYGLAQGKVICTSIQGNTYTYAIKVTQTAWMLCDIFQFEEEQGLGTWNCGEKNHGDTLQFESVLSHNVFSSDFRNYREKEGKGSDFFVFSKPILFKEFKKPIIFEEKIKIT